VVGGEDAREGLGSACADCSLIGLWVDFNGDHLNVLFPALQLVDVPALAKACTDRWYNQTLCKVNDSVGRLGVMQGEYTGTSMTMTMSSSLFYRDISSSIWRVSRLI
jgi:hypothetical protein